MMMKTTSIIALAAWLVTAAQGFSVERPSMAARPDASSAVEEALKITASFGIDSDEAKVAWDIVEEMDASDNRCVKNNCFSWICEKKSACTY